jgi:hypothetical protein
MPIPIQAPSGYAATRALAFADTDGSALLASSATPLPVTLGTAPTSALTGTATVSAQVGPYQPAIGRESVLTLSGSWTGTVRVLRSTDGGTTKLPLTVAGSPWAQFTGNCCEPVWDEIEAAARLYLDIALTAGSLNYRIAQ